MRYGHIHRCVESPDLCDEVPVPWSGNILVECKFDISDDGPEKENKISYRENVSSEVATYPFPVSIESLLFLIGFLLCSDAFANTALQRLSHLDLPLQTSFTYPLIVSK